MPTSSNGGLAPQHRALRQRLAQGATWLAMEAISSRGMMVLSMMLCARWLGTEQFGKLNAIQATLMVLSGLIADAMRLTAARHIAVIGDDDPNALGRAIGFVFSFTASAGLVVAIGLYLVAPALALHVLHAPELTGGLRIGVALLFFDAINGLCIGVLIGFREFRTSALAGTVAGVSLLILVLLWARIGIDGVLWALTLASAVGVAFRTGFIRRIIQRRGVLLRMHVRGVDWRLLLRFSIPALLTGLLWAPVNWAVTVMLVNSPHGYHSLGILGVANQWFSLLLFLPNIVGTAMLPVLSAASGRGDARGLIAAVKLGVRTNLQITLPTVLVVATFSGVIMSLYGPDYKAGWPVLALIAFAAAAASMQNLFGNLLASIDQMWASVIAQVTWAAFYGLSAFLLLRLGLGATGIAMAMLIGYTAKLVHVIRCAVVMLAIPRTPSGAP
jgi:O-antigen/teichoic acid export membrane protein